MKLLVFKVWLVNILPNFVVDAGKEARKRELKKVCPHELKVVSLLWVPKSFIVNSWSSTCHLHMDYSLIFPGMHTCSFY
jgi:hypothetical protein